MKDFEEIYTIPKYENTIAFKLTDFDCLWSTKIKNGEVDDSNWSIASNDLTMEMLDQLHIIIL